MYSPPPADLPLLLGAALLFIGALLQSLGHCPFAGHTHEPRRVLTLAAFIAGTTAVASLATALIHHALLSPQHLEFLSPYAAIVCVALAANVAQGFARRVIESTAPLSSWLMQIAVLGAVLIASAGIDVLVRSTFIAAIGLPLLLILGAAQRERLQLCDVPAPFRGLAIQVLNAGIGALALMGFAGLV